MNCPTCGTDNREGARFCRGCGALLAEPQPVETEPAEGQAVAEETATSPPDEPEAESVEESTPLQPEPEVPAAEAEAAPVEYEPDAGRPIAEEPVEKEEESDLPPEPDVEAFWRDEAEPLEPASAGTVIADRYELVEVLDQEKDEILYLAHDLVACWQCGFDGNTPGDAFCAQCGVSLDLKAKVHLLEVADAESQPADDQAVAARFEHEGRTFLLLAEAEAEQAPEAEVEAESPVASIRLLIGQRSDPGQVRELNEDSTLVLTLAPTYQSRMGPVLGLVAVADGMGGHEGGEVASKMALQELVEQVTYTLLLPEMAGDLVLDADIIVSLRQAVMAANDAVFLTRQKAGNDMGTTLTAAYIRDDRLFLAHVGDCRAYRWNAEGLTQLTTDHSVVASMVANGQIAPDEIYTHPHRSIIYRSIGDKPLVEVDADLFPLAPGDRLVLCSDGLWEMIRSEGIADVLMQEADPQQACDLLVQHANAAGGDDNISVVVVQVGEAN